MQFGIFPANLLMRWTKTASFINTYIFASMVWRWSESNLEKIRLMKQNGGQEFQPVMAKLVSMFMNQGIYQHEFDYNGLM